MGSNRSLVSHQSKQHYMAGILPILLEFKACYSEADKVLKPWAHLVNDFSHQATINKSDELEIISAILKVYSSNGFGLRSGLDIPITAYGPYSSLIMSASSLTEALSLSDQYQALGFGFCDVSYELNQSFLEMRFRVSLENSALKRFILERELAGYLRFSASVMETQFEHASVGFERDIFNEEEEDLFRTIFKGSLSFNQNHTWIRIPNYRFNEKLPHSHETMFDYYLMQCRQRLESLEYEADNEVDRIQKIIRGYENTLPSITEVASGLGISERSLRRNLSAEGVTFRQLIETHRSDLAKKHLKNSSTVIDELAGKLGYRSTPSFITAFKKWTGYTPGQYAEYFKKGLNLGLGVAHVSSFSVERFGDVIVAHPRGTFDENGIQKLREAIIEKVSDSKNWVLIETPKNKAALTPEGSNALLNAFDYYTTIGCKAIGLEITDTFGDVFRAPPFSALSAPLYADESFAHVMELVQKHLK